MTADDTDASDDEGAPVDITLTGVHAVGPDAVAVPLIIDEWAEDGDDHTIVAHWARGFWWFQSSETSNAGVCVIEEGEQKLLAVGVDGDVDVSHFVDDGTETIASEQIGDPEREGPSYSLLLRCARKIGGRAVTAGMARQVYRRDGPGSWVRIDAGTFVPRAQRSEAIGFNAIDGLSLDELWAVGFGGEIWNSRGGTWRQIDSPTNLALNGVVCAPSGQVYACGMAGMVLQGRGDAWELVHHAETTEDFWGIARLADEVFVSSYDGIFRIVDETLERVDLKLPEITTAYLDAANGAIWSVGTRHVASSRNGRDWALVRTPEVRM